jgi:hypothetical protein
MKKLKVYIWAEFCPDYTDGLAIAIAESEEEARKLVMQGSSAREWGPVEVRDISKLAYSVEGGE